MAFILLSSCFLFSSFSFSLFWFSFFLAISYLVNLDLLCRGGSFAFVFVRVLEARWENTAQYSQSLRRFPLYFAIVAVVIIVLRLLWYYCLLCFQILVNFLLKIK